MILFSLVASDYLSQFVKARQVQVPASTLFYSNIREWQRALIESPAQRFIIHFMLFLGLVLLALPLESDANTYSLIIISSLSVLPIAYRMLAGDEAYSGKIISLKLLSLSLLLVSVSIIVEGEYIEQCIASFFALLLVFSIKSNSNSQNNWKRDGADNIAQIVASMMIAHWVIIKLIQNTGHFENVIVMYAASVFASMFTTIFFTLLSSQNIIKRNKLKTVNHILFVGLGIFAIYLYQILIKGGVNA